MGTMYYNLLDLINNGKKIWITPKLQNKFRESMELAISTALMSGTIDDRDTKILCMALTKR